MGILKDFVNGFLDLAERELQRKFFLVSSNLQSQQVTRLLFNHPAPKPPRNLTAIPADGYVTWAQARLCRRAISFQRSYDQQTACFPFRSKAQRGSSVFGGPQVQAR